MQSSTRLLAFALVLAVTLSSHAALASINYGDFLGTNVDFRDVTETTQTAGDPEPLWEAPSLAGTGDQLVFFPSAFTSSCALGGGDVTSSLLETTIEAKPGVNIETIAMVEAGDAILVQSPPFGTPLTNGSVSLTGTVTVVETTSGPIAPVVIPFVGSFTPSDTFALPANFGASNWTGSFSVDVASMVPLATKVELDVDNTLETNCAAGQSSATVQKKSVSGPSVAILINPLECSLELDKTCCVTQPALPEFGECEGDLVKLELEYTGDSCRASSNDQGHAFKCYGRRRLGEPAHIDFKYDGGIYTAVPDNDVHKGDIVEITSSTGTFNDWTKIKTRDAYHRRQLIKLDTSCDRAIQCDDHFGAYRVVGFESTEGGVVDCDAPPPPPECAPNGDPVGTPCDDYVVDIVFEYTGQACQHPLPNPQGGYADCSGDATGATDVGIVYTGPFRWWHRVSPASGLDDGDRFRVSRRWGKGGLWPLQSYKIVDAGGVRQTVDLKVSCSKPLALGDEFGSLKVVEFTTKSGNTFALGDGDDPPFDSCEVPLAPPGPHCTSDLQELTLVYIGDFLGEGCTVSNPQGGYGTCSGDADPGDPVSVAAASGLVADPEDLIEFGDLVSISADGGGDLPGLVNLDVTGAGGTQSIQIKASCWKPLSLGDRFGSFVVFGMDREDDGPISLGGNIQYQYTVTNPNDATVENVAVNDDQLGEIVSGVTLTPGETQTFIENATLYGTTTNVATATGDVGGDVCDPGIDQVTVSVTAPPPGSFYCSEPITELTLIWNGAQTVDVKVWEGAVGGNRLHTFQNVAPGQAIEATGLGADYPTFEIFDETGTVKLGESSFDLWCNDKSMNGIEDCGKNNGNLKYDDPSLNNDWLLEGMVDTDETLSCTPGLVPNPPACGFGPELMFLLPGLLWWHRRRLQKA